MGNREKFLKVYSNLPLALRKEIVLVIDEKPITWNVAFFEIDNNTPTGDVILTKLENLNII